MYTEKQVAAIVPKGTFAYDYCHYALRQTDAPVGYHYGCALAVLSALAPTDLKIWQFGSDAPPQIWVMLIGESRQDRKTSSIRIAEGIIESVAPERKGLEPGSREAFIDGLCEQSPQILIYGEMGDFLIATRAGGYLESLRTAMMGAFDGRPLSRKLSQDSASVEEPRLTLLGGVTPGLLEDHTNESAWVDGFMGRWAPIYAHRERSYSLSQAKVKPGVYEGLMRRAERYKDRSVGHCAGLSDEAAVWWAGDPDGKTAEARAGWYTHTTNRFGGTGKRRVMRALTGGLPALAMKVATLYAHDWAETTEDGWLLSLRAIQAGAAFAELVFDSQVQVLASLASSKYGKQRRSVLDVFAEDETPRTVGEIMRDAHPPMDLRTAKGVVESMVASQHLYQVSAESVGVDPTYSTIPPKVSQLDFEGITQVYDFGEEASKRRAGGAKADAAADALLRKGGVVDPTE